MVSILLFKSIENQQDEACRCKHVISGQALGKTAVGTRLVAVDSQPGLDKTESSRRRKQVTLTLLFLLVCSSFALALKRQRTMALAYNGRTTNPIGEFEWPPWHLDLHMDARQVFGAILASATRYASRLLSWVSSLTKGGSKDDGQKPIAQPRGYEVEDEVLIQDFQTLLFDCRLGGLSDSEALKKLHDRFPLHGDLINMAFEQFAGHRTDPKG